MKYEIDITEYRPSLTEFDQKPLFFIGKQKKKRNVTFFSQNKTYKIGFLELGNLNSIC